MPIYEYTCKKCGKEFEELIRGDEQPVCPACGSKKAQRQMSAPAGHVSNSAQPACPAKNLCGSSCCGSSCDMARWTS